MPKSSLVRVKHKGQVTIPAGIREELGLKEGSVLEVSVTDGSIRLEARSPIDAGKPVGKAEHERVMRELDELRRNWR